MAAVDIEAIKSLENGNNQTHYIDAVTILLKILDNILREPNNAKYRTIRLENKIVKEKLLALVGMRALLKQIGFVEIDGALNLSTNALMAHIEKYRQQIADRLQQVQSSNQCSIETPAASTSTGAVKKQTKQVIPMKPFHERVRFPKVIPFYNGFLQQLEKTSDQMQQYEDERLLSYGRKVIPLETLTEYAINGMRRQQKEQGRDASLRDPCFRDWLLVELTKWFNEKFFTWVNTLPCTVCGDCSDRARSTYVENDIRVEVTMCCNTPTKFPRYNDVVTLLETRKGRCGEYANCFTFFCRCLNYDARLIHGNFDHVWTEVYSVAQKRWIHVDPSENVIDAPLMYQYGWNRDIDYVIAFSRDDVQDVTWKYYSDHRLSLKHRKTCTEAELLKTIYLLREKRQANCSELRKSFLKKRTLCELIGMMLPRQPTDNEKKGRSSGTLNWKLARGEGQSSADNFYIFTPLAEEHKAKQFNLRYSCETDEYERFILDDSTNSKKTIKVTNAWQSCTFRWQSIFRKEERDWKMVYLARDEDSDQGEIEWSFDFTTQDNSLNIADISLRFETKTYEDGHINLRFLHNGEILPSIESIRDRNLKTFSISAILTKGKGDCAWQHTQLFRQPTATTTNNYPFELRISFK